jgi:hypothetical protein
MHSPTHTHQWGFLVVGAGLLHREGQETHTDKHIDTHTQTATTIEEKEQKGETNNTHTHTHTHTHPIRGAGLGKRRGEDREGDT